MFEIQIKVIQSIISAVGSIILSFSCEHTVGLDGAVWMVETIGFFFGEDASHQWLKYEGILEKQVGLRRPTRIPSKT